jgi:hypothetical protein
MKKKGGFGLWLSILLLWITSYASAAWKKLGAAMLSSYIPRALRDEG